MEIQATHMKRGVMLTGKKLRALIAKKLRRANKPARVAARQRYEDAKLAAEAGAKLVVIREPETTVKTKKPRAPKKAATQPKKPRPARKSPAKPRAKKPAKSTITPNP